MKAIWQKYREIILYLVFGVLTTLVNIIIYGVCTRAGMSTGWANALAWVLAVAFAYITNRIWVFRSENRTLKAVLREIISFVACRAGTGVLDQIIMVVGVDVISPRIVPAEYAFMWSMGLKIASNVLVIILNYIFSKVIIFRKKSGE